MYTATTTTTGVLSISIDTTTPSITTSTLSNNDDGNPTSIANSNNKNIITTKTYNNNNNNNNEPATGYKDYQCMCGTISKCKLENILKAPIDFHVSANESKYTCNVCDLPLHAICYEE